MDVYGAVSNAKVAELAQFSRGHRLTEAVVRDVLARGWHVEEVVNMDEFTLDWLIEADGVWLVYDTT